MIIKKVLVGDKNEAFIEDRFTSGINIISSDDNNKGKTIIIQSMMYALGNDPIFPSSFEYKKYYYAVELELSDVGPTSICRKGNSFAVILKGNLSVFDSLSEFKYYINKNLFHLPSIKKDGFIRLVDPMLFYQIFFVGQDNKDTSNIFNHGYYNKEDFISMIYSYSGIDSTDDGINENAIRAQIKEFDKERKDLEKKNKILNAAFPAIRIVSSANDRVKFEEKLSKVEKIKNSIIYLSSKRNNAISRKVKNEITLKELRSLNQTLSAGKLHCLDCNSNNIGYSTADKAYTFDISSVEMRTQILSAIGDKVNSYQEEADTLTIEINKLQSELKLVLAEDEVTIENLLLYKTDLVEASEADNKLLAINNELKKLKSSLIRKEETASDLQDKKEKIHSELIGKMNEFYKDLDPNGNLKFSQVFSKRQSVYSGVEETEYYLSKLYALLSVLNHPFPIIMDYFRDGELSSKKEERVLEIFGGVDNQVILTATLKEQELGKYDNQKNINHIDYAPHTPSKLLSVENSDRFISYMQKFSLIFK